MTLWHYPGEVEQGWEVPISHERIKVERTIPFESQLRHFCDVVRNGVVPRCSGEEGLKTLETTLAASNAMHTGIPVICNLL